MTFEERSNHIKRSNERLNNKKGGSKMSGELVLACIIVLFFFFLIDIWILKGVLRAVKELELIRKALVAAYDLKEVK
jgi:hypothetical protein